MAGRNRNTRADRYQDYDDYEEYARSRSARYDDRYDDDYGDAGYDDGYDDYGRDGRRSGRRGGYDADIDDAGYGSDGEYYGAQESYDDRYDDGYDDDYGDDGYDDYGDGYDDYGGHRRRAAAARGSRGTAGGRREVNDRGRRNTGRSGGSSRSAGARRSGRPVRDDSRGGRGGDRGGKKGKNRLVLFVVEVAILLAVLLFYFLSTRLGKVGKISINEDKIAEKMNDSVAEQAETGTMKGYMNIALFGVDSTAGELTKNTRSDTIIIASINQDTKEIKLCSVYRDTYLNLGNDSYNKCNAAYAKGGPEQAINMLNMNLDMNIANFVTVGFGGLTAAIDDLGGIDIDVDSAELPHLNSYQLTMSQELGYPYEELTQTGLLHLNGLQATAYCRIRYTAGDDFKRAARQREVLIATMEKAKQADAATLTKVVDDVSSKIVTNFDITEDILPLALQVANYRITEQDGFPQEDMRTTGTVGAKGSCVIPRDLDTNVVWLHKFLFGDENYTVSSQVQEYSAKVASDTAGIG